MQEKEEGEHFCWNMRKTQVSMHYKILQLIWRIGVLNWGSLGLLGHAKKGIRLVFITLLCSALQGMIFNSNRHHFSLVQIG